MILNIEASLYMSAKSMTVKKYRVNCLTYYQLSVMSTYIQLNVLESTANTIKAGEYLIVCVK